MNKRWKFYTMRANKPRKTKSCCEFFFNISTLNTSSYVISIASLNTLFCRAGHIIYFSLPVALRLRNVFLLTKVSSDATPSRNSIMAISRAAIMLVWMVRRSEAMDDLRNRENDVQYFFIIPKKTHLPKWHLRYEQLEQTNNLLSFFWSLILIMKPISSAKHDILCFTLHEMVRLTPGSYFLWMLCAKQI